MKNKSSDATGLPAEAQNFIERIARKCSWRRSIRKAVRRELTAHFEDALSEVDETERDASVEALIRVFGDPALLAALIGRGKRRCQPWWERALWMAMKVAAVLLAIGIIADVVLSRRSGEALQTEIARLHNAGAPTSVREVIENAQKDPRTKELSPEERLKRCPATALLYEISEMHPELATDVRGKRVFDLGDTCAFVKRLYETWDADTAAAVNATLSRNRDLLEKIHALASLSPDDPIDIIWFQSQYWPEKSRELGLPDHGPFPVTDVNLLARPYLFGILDSGGLLALNAVCAVQEDKPDAALDEATTLTALTYHFEKVSRTLVGTMVAVAMRSEATYTIVEPLLNRADVSESATNRFQVAAAQMNCSESFANVLVWERMFAISFWKSGAVAKQLQASQGDRNILLKKLQGTLLDPYVLFDQLLPFLDNSAALAWIDFQSHLIDAAKLPYPEYKETAAVLMENFKKTAAGKKTGDPYFVNIKDDITECQVLESLARVAFALRRYKLARGAYPDSLQALAPEFLSEVPTDRFTEKPLLYRKGEEGCVMYSVGKGLDDEGGEGDDCAWKLTR